MAAPEQEKSSVLETEPPPGVVVREGTYGTKIAAVEPGGAEFIPLNERHGKPLQLFWTWTSPNFEFATVFVGVIGVAIFGLNFWQALLAIVIGTGIGSVTHGLLSARGPQYGVPQMVLSRLGFGYWGNVLPAGLNALTAGIGWFAVNSVSGTFALNTLTHLPKSLCLVIIVVIQMVIAFFGHNLVHAFERYAFPILAIIFLVAVCWIFAKSSPGAPSHGGGIGGFLITLGAAFGYAVGWNPYAADYTRYFAPDTSKKAVALWSGLGVFVSCVLLEAAGAASATVTGIGAIDANPTGAFTGHLPTALADLTLLAIALGAIAANVLNIYSGALSFTAMGVKLPLALRRAIVAVVFGVIGFIVALTGLHDAGTKYKNFLLVIAYWIAPWLAVMFCDQFLRRRQHPRDLERLLFDTKYQNWAGPVAMLVGVVVSIILFSNQTEYVGIVPKHVPSVGDLTFEAGFLITAIIYLPGTPSPAAGAPQPRRWPAQPDTGWGGGVGQAATGEVTLTLGGVARVGWPAGPQAYRRPPQPAAQQRGPRGRNHLKTKDSQRSGRPPHPSRVTHGGKGRPTSRPGRHSSIVRPPQRSLGIRGRDAGVDHDQAGGIQAARARPDGQDRRVVRDRPQQAPRRAPGHDAGRLPARLDA